MGNHRDPSSGLHRWGVRMGRRPRTVVLVWVLLSTVALALALGGVTGKGLFDDLTSGEKRIVADAFQKPLAQFLRGEEVQWGTRAEAQIRTLKKTGEVVVEDDERMQDAVTLWKTLSSASPRLPRDSKL